jgi:hypothetical protein
MAEEHCTEALDGGVFLAIDKSPSGERRENRRRILHFPPPHLPIVTSILPFLCAFSLSEGHDLVAHRILFVLQIPSTYVRF